MPYQGHKNWNHWNVSLWLFNDEPLYREMVRVRRKHATLPKATRALLRQLPAETPDGAPYSYSSVYAALKDVEE